MKVRHSITLKLAIIALGITIFSCKEESKDNQGAFRYVITQWQCHSSLSNCAGRDGSPDRETLSCTRPRSLSIDRINLSAALSTV